MHIWRLTWVRHTIPPLHRFFGFFWVTETNPGARFFPPKENRASPALAGRIGPTRPAPYCLPPGSSEMTMETAPVEGYSIPVDAVVASLATAERLLHIAAEPVCEPSTDELELTVVMPCLNEERTLPICIDKALRSMEECGVRGEVVVVDNGSTDGSVEVAEAHGARVVKERRRGYGNALRRGFEEARGRYIIMGDCDDSYDFADLRRFVDRLRDGADLVMGNRFARTRSSREPCRGCIAAWGTPSSAVFSTCSSRLPWATPTAACEGSARTRTAA